MDLLHKPQSVNFNLDNLKPDMIEGYMKASDVTKLVCKEMRIKFDEILNDAIDGEYPHMLVVLKNREYDVISGMFLSELLELKPDEMKKGSGHTAKFKACMKHFVKFLVKVHRKAEKSPPVAALSHLQVRK